MKAMVYHDYGSPEVLKLQEIDKPVITDDDILVRVFASSVNWIDWHFLTGTPLLTRFMAGLSKPKNQVLGIDLAGMVDSIGANVTQFKPGDEVFGLSTHGCFAEYANINEANLKMKPAGLNFEEAASVFGAAVTALRALNGIYGILSGQNVLINGASGGVGSFAVQIAKAFGAEVTGVCSTRNLNLVCEIGADYVVDYTREDFTKSGKLYDLIFDAVAKRSFSDCKCALKSQGTYVTTQFSPVLALKGQLKSMTGSQRMVPLPPKLPNQSDLVFIKELLETGKVIPVIDRNYSLGEVPDALRYLADGHARGKVVLTI